LGAVFDNCDLGEKLSEEGIDDLWDVVGN